jgi:hypothetical protein
MFLHKAATVPFLLIDMLRPQFIAQQKADCSNEDVVINKVHCNDKRLVTFLAYNTGINFCLRGT